jgi:hypothetical protein
MINFSKGVPTKTIQGTRAMVSKSVFKYNGSTDSGLANRYRNSVIDG